MPSAIGVQVVVRDAVSLDDVEECTAPWPVEPGDLIAFAQGAPLRVVDVLPVGRGATAVPVLARPAALAIVGR